MPSFLWTLQLQLKAFWTELSGRWLKTRILHLSQGKLAPSSFPQPLAYPISKIPSDTAGITIETSPYGDSLKRRRKGATSANLDLESKDFVAKLLKYGNYYENASGSDAYYPTHQLEFGVDSQLWIRTASHEEELFWENHPCRGDQLIQNHHWQSAGLRSSSAT